MVTKPQRFTSITFLSERMAGFNSDFLFVSPSCHFITRSSQVEKAKTPLRHSMEVGAGATAISDSERGNFKSQTSFLSHHDCPFVFIIIG